MRYQFMKLLGHFGTELSEHFLEYVLRFIKSQKSELISCFGISLDGYSKRCEEHLYEWSNHAKALGTGKDINHQPSNEYAASILNSLTTKEKCLVYCNEINKGYIRQLPINAAFEEECLVDKSGIQPQMVENIPLLLIELIRTNINFPELVVDVLLKKNAIVFIMQPC